MEQLEPYKISTEMDHKIVILDVQGFQFKTSPFFCKELAFQSLDGTSTFHNFFNFPTKFHQLNYSEQKHMNWVTHNIHGLEWETNNSLQYITLHEILHNNQLIQDAHMLVVKGYQKQNWLKLYLPEKNIVNIEIYGCSKLESLRTAAASNGSIFHCNKHLNNFLYCALENIQLLSSIMSADILAQLEV